MQGGRRGLHRAAAPHWPGMHLLSTWLHTWPDTIMSGPRLMSVVPPDTISEVRLTCSGTATRGKASSEPLTGRH